eukprot:scaffold576743_cov14-Prasinocladus_malaysianus.AAC.1
MHCPRWASFGDQKNNVFLLCFATSRLYLLLPCIQVPRSVPTRRNITATNTSHQHPAIHYFVAISRMYEIQPEPTSCFAVSNWWVLTAGRGG